MEETRPVVVQHWAESERGWGQRPDGVSIHRTVADKDAFIKNYWDSLPKYAPNEYSFPSGTELVDVSQENYDAISGLGDRYYKRPQWSK